MSSLHEGGFRLDELFKLCWFHTLRGIHVTTGSAIFLLRGHARTSLFALQAGFTLFVFKFTLVSVWIWFKTLSQSAHCPFISRKSSHGSAGLASVGAAPSGHQNIVYMGIYLKKVVVRLSQSCAWEPKTVWHNETDGYCEALRWKKAPSSCPFSRAAFETDSYHVACSWLVVH